MTAAERCMLLLCSTLGDESARPLSVARFRDLGRMARAFGSGGADPLRELGEQDLVRLGCRGEEASRVLALLSRERQLDAFLLRAERAGVHPLTRLDPAYPVRLRGVLGEACPPILFWKGNPALLQQTCISVVGSRELRPDNRTFAETAGRLIAESGYTKFPPRLPEQPIFYPVLNEEYAVEIASGWNAKFKWNSAPWKSVQTRMNSAIKCQDQCGSFSRVGCQ